MIPPVNIVIGAKSGAAIAAFTTLGNLVANLASRMMTFAGSVPWRMQSVIKNAVQYGDSLQKASLRTGIMQERLAGLGLALKLGDSNFEELIQAARGYARVGRGELLDSLLKTAGEFEKIEDATLRNRIALERYGRSALQLMPILSMGRAQLEQFISAGREIMMLPPEFGDRAVKFKDTLLLIHARLQGFGIMLADRVLPLLQTAAERLMDALMSPGVVNSINRLSESLRALVEHLSNLITQNLIERATEKLSTMMDTFAFLFAGLNRMGSAFSEWRRQKDTRPLWKQFLGIGKGPEPLAAIMGRKFAEGMEREFFRRVLSLTPTKSAKEPFNWRALLEPAAAMRRVITAELAGAITGVTAARGGHAGFLQRGFVTPFEARAVTTQISLQRETVWYLTQIASSLRELVPAMKEALG